MTRTGRPRTIDPESVFSMARLGVSPESIANGLGCSPARIRAILTAAGWKRSTAWEEPLPEVQDA